jgi:hypothetical protein
MKNQLNSPIAFGIFIGFYQFIQAKKKEQTIFGMLLQYEFIF